MLNWLFSKNKKTPLENEKEAIPRFLEPFIRQISALHIHLNGDNTIYSSTLLNINNENNTLLIDELIPSLEETPLTIGQRLHVSAKLQGEMIEFDTQLIEIDTTDNYTGLRIQLPDTIKRTQRRQYHRVPLGISEKTSLVMRVDDGQVVRGKVSDLSSGGFGALVDMNRDIVRGSKYKDCKLKVDNESIRNPIQIQFSQRDIQTNKLKIGVKFIDLTTSQQNKVTRLLNLLQRKRITGKRDKKNKASSKK